ncbi:NAD(P)-binding domain-containing protein [Methanolobus sp. ZRKC3]|uniref:NAD(P)-binding domain-containing protein n=1 Tax=Methanolobus sp. ZRKC3 TaxID=3125786 RepID=UPI0032451C72
MKIAILGGTGQIGRGFALRWGQKHDVIVGSRSAEKAEAAASEYSGILKEHGLPTHIEGTDNKTAAENADVVILAIRYNQLESLMELIKPVLDKQIIVSVVVPMEKNMCYIRQGSEHTTVPINSEEFNTNYFCFSRPESGSAAQDVAAMLPEDVDLVAAFHTVPAKKLANLEIEPEFDIGVCGNSMLSKEVIFDLIRDIPNMRPLDIGPLETAPMLEALTPLLINVSARNKMKDTSIKFI